MYSHPAQLFYRNGFRRCARELRSWWPKSLLNSNEIFIPAAPWALMFVVVALLLVCSTAEEQEAHSFQPGSHVSAASDADMMKAIR